MNLRKVDVTSLAPDIFQMFATKKALLTAGDKEKCNTMSIGWCQIGQLWDVPVCTVYVRQERYTYQFLEEKDYFTVSVMPLAHKKTIGICGTTSGRDVDKIKQCGLTLCYGENDAPFFDEAELVLVCKKAYAQDMAAEYVVDGTGMEPFYVPERGSWHRCYVGRIVEAYIK